MLRVPQSTTPLGANGAATYPAMNVGSDLSLSQISVHLISDQASATNGAKLQGSQDGTNWYVVAEATLAAATPTILQAPLLYPHFRVALTNGATAQTSLSVAAALT